MSTLDARDRLEPLGSVVGVLLVLFGLGFLYGQPWATTASTVALIIQLIGVVALIALGVGIFRLSRLE